MKREVDRNELINPARIALRNTCQVLIRPVSGLTSMTAHQRLPMVCDHSGGLLMFDSITVAGAAPEFLSTLHESAKICFKRRRFTGFPFQSLDLHPQST